MSTSILGQLNERQDCEYASIWACFSFQLLQSTMFTSRSDRRKHRLNVPTYNAQRRILLPESNARNFFLQGIQGNVNVSILQVGQILLRGASKDGAWMDQKASFCRIYSCKTGSMLLQKRMILCKAQIKPAFVLFNFFSNFYFQGFSVMRNQGIYQDKQKFQE